jgi:hypothetical protein
MPTGLHGAAHGVIALCLELPEPVHTQAIANVDLRAREGGLG